MRIILKVLKQDAVYWEQLALDEFNQRGFKDPVAIKVRWEDTRQEFISDSGTREISRSRIMVAQDMKPGDYIHLGELTSEMTNEPRAVEHAYAIKGWAKTPTLKATKFVRIVYL